MSARNRHWKRLPAMVVLLVLTACSGDNRPVKGFIQEKIVNENQACHTIPGMEFPEIENRPPFTLALGGEVYRVKNHGELLTAVVNPDQSICMAYRVAMAKAGREAQLSPMPYRGEDMTVAELVDLVTFLNAQYTKLQPQLYTGYYHPG